METDKAELTIFVITLLEFDMFFALGAGSLRELDVQVQWDLWRNILYVSEEL